MDNESKYHFRIRVGDIEVEASGPEGYVKEIREYADQLLSTSLASMKTMGALTPTKDTSLVVSDSTKTSQNQPLSKDESLVEFLERLPNKTHQEKILAFGYFLEKNRSIASFGAKEINDCYDQVREAKSNTAQYLTLLVKSGLIMSAKNQTTGNANQYVLTRKGEKNIDDSLGAVQQS
ncbi:MAG: hypothetical protein Q7T89_02025 [Anaerolineales bacterium]|nr:hypothetical protein [Anaerolineales bacterium]